ncbi:MAG: HemK2/MTQ2 family protein methyltransferase [Candidatus Pacearchaeota archaeon]
MAEIYSPSEDSYFFSEFLKDWLKKYKNKSFSYLDMGTGSGILSEVVSKFTEKKNILAVDINPSAVKFVRNKGFNSIKSNLFEKVGGKFDLVTFNAPYLPEDYREPKSSRVATTGGKKGDEISLEFLKQVKNHLNKNGRAFLLISSLTPMNRIKKFNGKIVARKKLFMEGLLLIEFSIPYSFK